MQLKAAMLCRPGLLLPVIKYLVFFNTFVFANSIFFATQFGRHSCFFSRTGFQGWVPISWWVSACLSLGHHSLPTSFTDNSPRKGLVGSYPPS